MLDRNCIVEIYINNETVKEVFHRKLDIQFEVTDQRLECKRVVYAENSGKAINL